MRTIQERMAEIKAHRKRAPIPAARAAANTR